MGKKTLRNIFSQVYNCSLGINEKIHNEELSYRLHGKPNILTHVRCKHCKRLKWLRHIMWRANGN